MAKIRTIEDYVASVSADLIPLGEQLTTLLDEALPAAEGVIWHGHPVWMLGRSPVAAYKAYASHLTFMIWNGQLLTDRSGRLEAAGSSAMANLKLHTVDDIDTDLFINWLNQATKLENP